MSDLRTRLERIGDRIDARQDAFERLDRARRRRERIRRIEAGVVALLVAVAGSLTAVVAFRDSEPAPEGNVEEGFFALWPEKTYTEALAGQKAVDRDLSGQLAWRLDPIATAEEFGRETLGWGWQTPDEDLVDAEVLGDGDVAGPGPITIEISTPPFPCPYPGPPACIAKSATVTLERQVWPDGVWSVVEVGGDTFDLRVAPGEHVSIGSVVTIPTPLDDGTEVAVGVKGTGACAGFHEETGKVQGGEVAIPIEGVGEGCAGYLYALTPPTPVGQVELGKIMFLWNEPKPALGYTIESIAAVPVRFVSPSAVELPSIQPSPQGVARISCDGSNLEVQTPVVGAQPDGVHVEFVNTGDRAIELALGDLETIGVVSAPVHPNETLMEVLTIEPGTWPVACSSPPESASAGVSALGSLEVVDPEGFFSPWFLDCPPDDQYARDGPMEGVTGDPRPPVQVARGKLTGLEPTDFLEEAGYAEASVPVVNVVRDGSIVGYLLFGWDEDSQGWVLIQLAGCFGTSFGWSAPAPTPNPDGWFEWCPEGPFPEAGLDWSERAAEVAIRFARAYVEDDRETLASVLDVSVPPGAEFAVALADGVEPIVAATDAHGGPLVSYSCGNDVDAYAVAITIDDGTESASADFTVFLVFRGDEGWKVWGVY
jgi:hypothetical protein